MKSNLTQQKQFPKSQEHFVHSMARVNSNKSEWLVTNTIFKVHTLEVNLTSQHLHLGAITK